MIHVFEDYETLCQKTVETILETGKETIQEKDEFTLILSGGNTPKKIYQMLAEASKENQDFWEKTKIWWGDERLVPPDDPASNYRMTKEALLDHVPIPKKNIFRIITEFHDLEKTTQTYTKYFPDHPDLNLLGLGPDGHTASLFPCSSALDMDGEMFLIAQGAVEPRIRITMSKDLLKKPKRTIVLVSGENKREALQRVFAEQGNIYETPARLVRDADWFLDQAATKGLDL